MAEQTQPNQSGRGVIFARLGHPCLGGVQVKRMAWRVWGRDFTFFNFQWPDCHLFNDELILSKRARTALKIFYEFDNSTQVDRL